MTTDRRTVLVAGLATGAAAAAGTVAILTSSGRRGRPDAARSGSPPPGTAPPPAPVARPRPTDLEELFRPGHELVLLTGTQAAVRVHQAGVLRLPTGRLIAADPYWLPSWPRLGIDAYTTTVPRGAYPVTLGLATWRDDSSTGAIMAAAKVTVRDTEVATWEFALRPGQDPATLAADEFFGVGVDVATIGLFDARSLTAMARLVDESPDAFRPPSADQPVEVADPGSDANLIGFSTGLGDGYYPVWVGRATDGSVACFVVDMLVR